MEYLAIGGGLFIGYLMYKQFVVVGKYDEYNQAVLTSKRLETLDQALEMAEPPDPSADVFIPCHVAGKPRPVRVTEGSKPFLF